MTSDVLIAIIASGGSSSVLVALIGWASSAATRKREKARAAQESDQKSLDIAKAISELSKSAVMDAKGSLDELRAEVRQMRSVLEELVRVVERDVIPHMPEQQEETRRHLRVLTSRAKEIS